MWDPENKAGLHRDSECPCYGCEDLYNMMTGDNRKPDNHSGSCTHTMDGGNLAPPNIPYIFGTTVFWGSERVQHFWHRPCQEQLGFASHPRTAGLGNMISGSFQVDTLKKDLHKAGCISWPCEASCKCRGVLFLEDLLT